MAVTASPVQKRAHATASNVGAFVDLFGLENVGLFTVTFAEKIDCRESQRRLHNFAKRVLSVHLGEYIRVREFHLNGNPHYHFVIHCKGDIRSGFNWAAYDAVRDWNKARRVGPKPRVSLGRNEHLIKLHSVLNSKGAAYGIGRMELVPLKSTSEAVGRYLGGYLAKSQAHQPDDAYRTRSVSYSQGFTRMIKGTFSWVTPRSWLWRAKLKAWAAKHDCKSLGEIKAVFGPRWAYHHRENILSTPLYWYPTIEHLTEDRPETGRSLLEAGITNSASGFTVNHYSEAPTPTGLGVMINKHFQLVERTQGERVAADVTDDGRAEDLARPMHRAHSTRKYDLKEFGESEREFTEWRYGFTRQRKQLSLVL